MWLHHHTARTHGIERTPTAPMPRWMAIMSTFIIIWKWFHVIANGDMCMMMACLTTPRRCARGNLSMDYIGKDWWRLISMTTTVATQWQREDARAGRARRAMLMLLLRLLMMMVQTWCMPPRILCAVCIGATTVKRWVRAEHSKTCTRGLMRSWQRHRRRQWWWMAGVL